MDFVTVERRDGVALVRADRPPANAMNLDFLAELVGQLEGLASDPPQAAVVAGREGFFSAGVDLKAVPGYGPDEQRQLVEAINAMVLVTYGLPCPVVAAITGHAIAGGFVLAMGADHRVASAQGSYGLTEVKVGVPYPAAALGVVAAELSPAASRVLVLGNRLTDAADCLRLGAFDEVVEPAAVVDRALAVAAELAELPSDVYAMTKRALRGPALESMRTAAAADPLLAAASEPGD